MFEQTFVEGTGKTQKRLDGDSCRSSCRLLVVGVLVLIPLIYTDTLPQGDVDQFSDCAAAASASASSAAAAAVVKVVKVAPRQFDAGRLMAPKSDSQRHRDDQGRGSAASLRRGRCGRRRSGWRPGWRRWAASSAASSVRSRRRRLRLLR